MDPDLKSMTLVQSGDEVGLVELMDRHKDALFRFLTRYTGNASDAAEITEETFVRVFLKAQKYKPVASVKSWMYAIATNLARDRFRRTVRRPAAVSLHEQVRGQHGWRYEDVIPDRERSPDEEVGSSECLSIVMNEIERLPHRLKTPFLLCALEGLSQGECASMLNISVKSVETRIYRARRILKKSCRFLTIL